MSLNYLLIKLIILIINILQPREEYTLEYEDVSKLEGLGWIEYSIPLQIYTHFNRCLEIEFKSIILVSFVEIIEKWLL